MQWLSIPLDEDIDDNTLDRIIDMLKVLLPNLDTENIFIEEDDPQEERPCRIKIIPEST